MSSQTTNLHLIKPSSSEVIDIDDINDNMDIIDAAFQEYATGTRVKGNEETQYRTGDVNLTPANIGAVNVHGDTMTGSLGVTGNVTASGEVTATEHITGGSDITHNLTDKLNEDDYLSGITWDALASKFTWDDLAGTQGSDTTTPNLGLVKPARVSASASNSNMDILDTAVASKADAVHNHSGQALTPASVAATGAVSGSSISDGTGTLAQLRESVSHFVYDGNYLAMHYEKNSSHYQVTFTPTSIEYKVNNVVVWTK